METKNDGQKGCRGLKMKKLLAVIALIVIIAVIVAVFCFGKTNKSSAFKSEMVNIPAGGFMMGCNETVDKDCPALEKPYHKVSLDAYKIDKYEVTAGEYKECIKAGACNNTDPKEPHFITVKDNMRCNIDSSNGDNYPANCVSWFGASAFCKWKGRKLPTEAQWEYAARGTDGRKYPWGNTPPDPNTAVWNSDATQPVGSKEAGKSAFGIYDMTGNVWEWTEDWFARNYYAQSPESNPKGPESATMKVIRGGSFSVKNELYLRTSSRNQNSRLVRADAIGFRCVQEK